MPAPRRWARARRQPRSPQPLFDGVGCLPPAL